MFLLILYAQYYQYNGYVAVSPVGNDFFSFFFSCFSGGQGKENFKTPLYGSKKRQSILIVCQKEREGGGNWNLEFGIWECTHYTVYTKPCVHVFWRPRQK